jgi:hypothetical protein
MPGSFGLRPLYCFWPRSTPILLKRPSFQGLSMGLFSDELFAPARCPKLRALAPLRLPLSPQDDERGKGEPRVQRPHPHQRKQPVS